MREYPPRFAIFYHDGNVVEGGGPDDEVVEITFRMSKSWLEAPSDGIQAVVVENPYSCRYVWRGQDYYFMLPDQFEIHAADDIGPYLRVHLQGMMKFGLCLGERSWEQAMARVKEYTGIPTRCDRKPRPDDDLE